MISVFATPANPQRDCPLFNKIPREIRDNIFDLVMTPLEDEEEYDEDLREYRPEHPGGPFSATLLRCCQSIYFEAWSFLPKKYVQLVGFSGDRCDFRSYGIKRFNTSFPSAIQNLCIYFTPRRTYSRREAIDCWRRYTQIVGEDAPNLRRLKLIVNPCDLWKFTDMVANSKTAHGTLKDMEDSDLCHKGFWGYHLQALESLVVMEFELHTLERHKGRLDLLIEKAAGWQFPLAKGKEMVLMSQKTKWMWWRESSSVEPDFLTFPSIYALSSRKR